MHNPSSVALWLGMRLLLAGAALIACRAALAQGQAPALTVAITGPGSVVTAPATIELTASASVNRRNWTILQVEFYSGEQLLGTATNPPYRITWSNVTAGHYDAVTAKAIATNAGQAKQDPAGHANMPTWEARSAPIDVIVNAPPAVSVANPSHGALFTEPATFTLVATAADSDGTVAKVAFFQGTALVATVSSSPYAFTLANVAAGTYRFTAEATDNQGATATSAALSVLVNAPPTVSLSSPANNARFTAPANITLTAEAADTDGTIAQVDFYNGTTLIDTRTGPPYSIVWTDVPGGGYSLSARATDNLGATTTSAPLSVTVNAAVAELYYIHADHLNTPRLVANQSGQAVWRWDQQEPFGVNVPDENPSGLGAFEFPLRFPGQYADRETGLFYNYHRNYTPDLDRYIESDPIGIRGGVNVYVYVLDPLTQIDPLGLMGFGAGANYPGPRPGTGNIWPGTSPQNWICDQPAGFLNMNPCVKRCCIQHDRCFEQNKCNWSSWFGNIYIGTTFPCNQCNTEARKCVQENWNNASCGICN